MWLSCLEECIKSNWNTQTTLYLSFEVPILNLEDSYTDLFRNYKTNDTLTALP